VTPEERTVAALGEVEVRLHDFVNRGAARATRHSPHYAELWRTMRTAVSGGKRVRPQLLLSSYTQLTNAHDEPAIQLAVAIELLHTALLVHDDIIDGDDERRGAPNLVGAFRNASRAAGLGPVPAERWGETAGILAGDLLLMSALRMGVLPDLDRRRADRIAELLDESIFRAAAGELADVAYAVGLTTPSVGDIRDMMADKTAHYSLELPLRAAAVLADAGVEIEERLGAVGRSLGILFQMQDDLLGVFGDPERTGKSASGDLREGKQTLLVAFARDTEPWRSAAAGFGDPGLDERGADALRHALEASGARASFEAEIRRERDHAVRLIHTAGLPAQLEHALCRAADQAMERHA
jgi:geranylgeranyl diphosphate synthase type II